MNSIEQLIEIALQEDIGSGDITTDNLVKPDIKGHGKIIAKEQLVIAGLDIACRVFERLDPQIVYKPLFTDGDRVKKGEVVVEVEGRLCSLLVGERAALNFLQRLSGIATHVRSYVDMLGDRDVRLVDTRKTVPGWRVLEKYAVRVGGAHNHRMGLYDGVLIKDNHISVCGGINKAVSSIRNSVSHFMKIEVEVSDIDGVREAIDSGVDIIMLDNMDIKQIKEAVEFINGKAMVEVSGGITIDDLNYLVDAGVDIISSGALTHHAKSVDLSMRIGV
ncbi:MAG: carboxylating nicotinate-nucleotide diphosphorylase [Deltaproteobacteria bacterium]|nr:carboxylating nicotinate-nucleotide diphosphorylase [Deltaproteobacteria bacterium]MBW2661686.1 carboxylating nicotinate-nucleotide diphosphorylase [Deltaproteobacteria bacterium]